MQINNRDILCVLYTAKSKFISDRNTHNYAFGMCFYLQYAISIVFNEYHPYDDIKDLIPEFVPETFGLNVKNNQYWWDVEDVDSRIKAFDKLIEIYKNKINGNI